MTNVELWNKSYCCVIFSIFYREQEVIQAETCDGIYTMTEGQMADYMASEMSGDYGEWVVDIVTYKCSKCGKTETERNI